MRINFLVFYHCYLIHAVVQQQTGESNHPKLSHKHQEGRSRNVNMSHRHNALYKTRVSNFRNKRLQSYKMAPIARKTINSYTKTNNEEGLDKFNKHRFKFNGENGSIDPLRKKKNVSEAKTIEYVSKENDTGIYSTPAPPVVELYEAVQQLVLEMKKLHTQQETDRQSLASLRQQLRSKLGSARNAHKQIEITSKQLEKIQLVLKNFDAENKITRNEISRIKSNQQRFLETLHAVSRSNGKLVNKLSRISDICKRGLFLLAQGNDLDESKVINNSINAMGADSGEIQEDIRKLKENMETANLEIELQANVRNILEDKINRALVFLHNIERTVSQMEDGIDFGQSVTATKVFASSKSHEKMVSSKGRQKVVSSKSYQNKVSSTNHQNMVSPNEKLEFNDQPERKQNSEVHRRDGGKRRKSRHLSSLTLLIQRSESNVEDGSKKNHGKLLLQDNNVGDKTIHAYGVLGTQFGVNGNNKINIEEENNKTSLSKTVSGPLEEPDLILLQEAGPVLPSSCCPHLHEQLQLSTAVKDLHSVSHTLSGKSISIDLSWPSFLSPSKDSYVPSVFVPSLLTSISDMVSMSSLYETEPSQLRHKTTTSEQFLLSNSIAEFQSSVMKSQEQIPLSISRERLSISSTVILSPSLSQTPLILEPLNFDLSGSEITDDQSLHVDDINSSSHWLESPPSNESDTGLTSLIDPTKEGALAVSRTTTDDHGARWQGSFEVTSPRVSPSATHSNSLEPVLGADSFFDKYASTATQTSPMWSVSNVKSRGDSPSSPLSSNNKQKLVAQTTLDWDDTTSLPCMTCYTSHQWTTGRRISGLSSSYTVQSESSPYFDQIDASYFSPVEPKSYAMTPVLGVGDIQQTSLHEALSIDREETIHVINSLESPQATPPVDFPNNHMIYPRSSTPVATEIHHFTQSPGLSETKQFSLHYAKTREEIANIMSSLASPHSTESVNLPSYQETDYSSMTSVVHVLYTGTPVIQWSVIEHSPFEEKLPDVIQERVGNNENAITVSTISHAVIPEDSTEFDQTFSNLRISKTRAVNIATHVIYWSGVKSSSPSGNWKDVKQRKAGSSEDAITFSTISHTINFEDSTSLDQNFSNLRTSKTTEFSTTTPAIDGSDVETSSLPGNLNDEMLIQAKEGEDTVTRAQFSNSATSVDPTNIDQTNSSPGTSEIINVDVTTSPVDWSVVESSSLTGQLLTLLPTGTKENENDSSKLSNVALSEDTKKRDKIYPSSRTLDTTEPAPTTVEINWSDIERSLVIEKLHDEMTTGAEEIVNIINSPTMSQLVQPQNVTNLVYVGASTSETIDVVTASPVVDGSDIGPSFPVENPPDLLSARVDVGRQRSLSTQSDDDVHREEMNFSRATSTGSQNPTILSVLDTSSSLSIESLPDDTPTQEKSDTDMFSSQSDIWYMQLNPGSYSDGIKTGSATGVVPEINTITPVIDWSGGVASLPFGHLRNESSTRSEEDETKANSPVGSHVVLFESFANTGHISSGSATFATPEMSRVTSVITWPELETSSAKGNLPDLISATVVEVTISVTHSRYINDVDANHETPGTSDIDISQGLDNLSSLQPLGNMHVTPEREINVLNVNHTDQMSELAITHNKTIGEEYNRYVRHLEQRLTFLEKSMIQMTSGIRLPSQDVNALILNTSIDLQTELEAYVENRMLDLMQQFGRDALLVQRQHNDLKQEFEKQHAHVQNRTSDLMKDLKQEFEKQQAHVQNRTSDLMKDLKQEFEKQQAHVQNRTSDLMKELERQRLETKNLKEELENQKAYANIQIAEVKQVMDTHKELFQNQTSDFIQKFSEQNVYIENQTQPLQEQLHTQAVHVGRLRKAAIRTSKMVTYLARQVSAINMDDFTSRLRESLHNFTTNVLTQEQWRVSSQRIVNASLEHEAKISQIQTTLMDTTHSITKLQGRVRNIHQMGERWYRSLQGHVIRLNNTVQDLRENGFHLGEVNKDQTTDYSLGGNAQLQERLDSLAVQLLYNTNRLSSLEVSMLNLSLTQCRRPLAEANQASKILAMNDRQDDINKELSMMKDKVNAVDLTMFKAQSSLKAAEKALSSLRGNISSLVSLVPGLQALRKEMDNVLFLVPQDCQEYIHQGHTQSGIYVIHPKKFNRTFVVYCLMEDSSSTNCQSCRSYNKGRNPISQNSINSGFSQRGNRNNHILSAADNLPEMTESNKINADNKDMTYCTGWTVIQRRTTGMLNFTRSWTDYAEGFGTAESEYWAGNEFILKLTIQKDYELRIIMEDVSSVIWEATYSEFKLAGKEEAYRIHLNGYSGNATDGMASCNSSAFSTVDFDNDGSSSHCALFNGGGWWYGQCHVTNLNGPYDIGMVWFNSVLQDWIQMRSSVMMVRPKNE